MYPRKRAPDLTPLVFTTYTSGSASPAATVVLKRLAARLAEARDLSYSMGWLRCRLSFCLLRCAVMCFRGSRSRRTTAPDNVPNLAGSAARVNFAACVCLFHFFRSTSCFVCLPCFLLSLRLVPLFCFVIFFIYCLLFVTLGMIDYMFLVDLTKPAYSDTETKFSSQTQPRKCAPTANLDTQLTAFCTRSTFCTRRSKLVAEF